VIYLLGHVYMEHNKTGLIKNNGNKFAAIYRFIDICIIHISVFIAAALYVQSYNREYFLVALLGSLGFSLIAESFSLYRSWRVGSFKELMFYTFVSWCCSAVLTLPFPLRRNIVYRACYKNLAIQLLPYM